MLLIIDASKPVLTPKSAKSWVILRTIEREVYYLQGTKRFIDCDQQHDLLKD